MRIADLPKYELKPEEIKAVDQIISKHKGKNGAVIPVLQQIQKRIGFIPIDVQKKVAVQLGIPDKNVYGVATFYSFFSLMPRGKYNIQVCMGTACFVKGGKKIVDNIQKELGIKPGQTTNDRKYSLQVTRCVGACGIAPVIIINDTVYKKVNPLKVMDIVCSLE